MLSIIKEEVTNYLFEMYGKNVNRLTFNDLVDLYLKFGSIETNDPELRKQLQDHVRQTLLDVRNKSGDEGLVKYFEDVTQGVRLYVVAPGRYATSPHHEPHDYEPKWEE